MQAAVPLPLAALDESFHPVLPSTVSAPILDSKPGQAAELRAELSQPRLISHHQVCPPLTNT